ncbi:hypothetical protein HY972_01375 [Candidatus Kaiserbacteria bacterium]|nr:hypothetical protein [Candidatus Kaiserbacteria bacterium]
MTFKDFIGSGTTGIVGILNTVVVPIIFALAFVAFVLGVVKYFFLTTDNEGDRAAARKFVLWGILGMALLFSVWGVVNILLSTLGITP